MDLLPLRMAGMAASEDLPPFEAPADVWTYAQGVNFRQGLAERVTGQRSIFPAATGVPLHIRNSFFNAASYWIYCTGTTIRVIDSSGTHYAITPTSAPAQTNPNGWTSCELNGLPVFNWGGIPVYWARNTAVAAQALPGWVTNSTCQVIRAFKNYLLALNYFDGTNSLPSVVKWSGAALPGQAPTTWTAAANNDAGDISLGGASEGITDGLTLRDQFMVYKTHSTWSMQFVGGIAIFGQRQLSSSIGALSANCVAEYRGNHIVLGDNDVFVTDGQSIKSLVHNRARRNLFSRLSTSQYLRSYLVAHPLQNEVWICIPEEGSDYANLALVWNGETDKLSYREIKFAASDGSPFITSGNVSEAIALVSYASILTTYATETRTYDDFQQDAPINGLVGINIDTPGLVLADSKTALSSKPVTLNKTGMDLGERDRVKLITEVWPRITGNAGTVVQIRVGGQMEPDDPVVWDSAYDYVLGTTMKIDCGYSTRFMAIEMSGNASGNWRATGFDVKAQLTSRY